MNIKYDENGLIPAIVQDYKTKEVLMMAYMNADSLKITLDTKETCFYSRSRKALWKKGETSGNTQKVKSIAYDCDEDTLLIKVEQTGEGACHTGAYSCFYRDLYKEEGLEDLSTVIDDLAKTIKGRKENPVKDSYTNYLFDQGLDKILKKVGEESAEVIIASKNHDKGEMIYELSDLVYHSLVLMEEEGVTLDQIRAELSKRFK